MAIIDWPVPIRPRLRQNRSKEKIDERIRLIKVQVQVANTISHLHVH